MSDRDWKELKADIILPEFFQKGNCDSVLRSRIL